MGRPKDIKTSTLYVYVQPENKQLVQSKKEQFGSESNYIDELLTFVREHELEEAKKPKKK